MLKISRLFGSVILAAAAFVPAGHVRGQTPPLEKVSAHCYLLPGGSGTANVAAIVTQDGTLLVNPPPEPGLTAAIEELKKISAKPVRWVVCTEQAREQAGGAAALSRQGALFITSSGFRKSLPSTTAGGDNASPSATSLAPTLELQRQIRIFPENLEIRIQAPEREWHQGGDVVVFLPAEKILLVGNLYSPGSLPALEGEAGSASALAWLEALKQVIDMVPLLKPAMPAPKSELEGPPEEPKSLEELVTVIPAIGPPSNLQEMKDLLATAQKVRADVARAGAQKRNRETFLDLPMFSPYRGLANFESFATRLFDELRRR